jgi:2-polyprenyl-3-methyl-5-hydroxy-6-metoxy-1,4-benzoquinol methylase
MCESTSENFKILGRRLNCSQGFNPKNKVGISTTIVKCKKCSLIFSNPIPIPSNISNHYGVPPENYWKDNYFIIDDTYFKAEIKIANSLLNTKENLKALDIGAGIGKCMVSLNNAGFDTYGIEPSSPFYQRAIEIIKISPDRLKLCSLENANFPSDNFDFITFGAVLEHLYNPSESLKRALYWLKPGGVIHAEIPSSGWLTNKIVNLLYKIRGIDYVANISPMHTPYHLYEFDLKSFKLNAKLIGYEVVHYQYFVCETYLPSFLNFILKPIMKITNTGMQLSIWLRKN